MKHNLYGLDMDKYLSFGYLKKYWFAYFMRFIGIVIAIPVSIPFIIFGFISILSDRYHDVSFWVSLIPFYTGEYTRYFYYKATLKKVGMNVTFKFGSSCQYRNVTIGNNVTIGFYDLLGEIMIGNDVLIGSYVNFLSGTNQHSFKDRTKKIYEQPSEGRRMITVGSDVWIGNNCTIANDIGNRCVIGTGSVLINKAEDQAVYAGNPARLIKKLEEM